MKVQFGRGILSKKVFKNSIVVTALELKHLYGESHLLIRNDKSQSTYEKIHQGLFERGAGRDTRLIALGGGTILDVAAFAASTYMRGIPLVLIPTTLLAMVDASIGGKTAIDTPFGKNLIGSFYDPEEILIDFDLLNSLPENEKTNGFFEVIKMGLVYDSSLFDMGMTDGVLKKAAQAKLEIVRKDPKEKGLRRILNFGHTIGHGLEKIGEGLPHGVAVALGCIGESFLSMEEGFLKKEEFEKIVLFYEKFNLSLPLGYNREQLLEKMGFDKKKKDGKIRLCFIDRIGHAVPFDGEYCKEAFDLHSTLDYLERNYERAFHKSL